MDARCGFLRVALCLWIIFKEKTKMSDETQRREAVEAGWQCPKCSRVYSPKKIECDYCNSKSLTERIKR